MTISTRRRRRRPHGRPILGGITGLLFGLAISCALVSFGALPLSSVVLAIVPLALLALGIVWAFWAPLGRKRALRTARANR